MSDGTIGILFYLVLPSFADAKNSTEEKKTIQKRGRKSVKLLYAGVAIYSWDDVVWIGIGNWFELHLGIDSFITL